MGYRPPLHGTTIMCSIESSFNAQYSATIKGQTYGYGIAADPSKLFMQSVKIAGPTLTYQVEPVQSTVIAPGKRVLLGSVILNPEATDDTRYEDVWLRVISLEFNEPVTNIIDALSMRFDGSLSDATESFEVVDGGRRVSVYFKDPTIINRLKQRLVLLIEADVRAVPKATEITMTIPHNQWFALGAVYGVFANTVPVGEVTIPLTIGTIEEDWSGGLIQSFQLVHDQNSPTLVSARMSIVAKTTGVYNIVTAPQPNGLWRTVANYELTAGEPRSTTINVSPDQSAFFMVVRIR